MLNEKMDAVVLVKGWKKGANWSFPRGKINKDEPDLDCAIREVYEETGYDIKAAGLDPEGKATKYIEMNLREQHMRLYVFRGVPMDTYFEPRTRKEISKVHWWKLADLPTLKKKKQQHEGRGEDLAVNANKFYMVAPFLPQLKKWISLQKKLDKAKHEGQSLLTPNAMDEERICVEVSEPNGAPKDLPVNGDFGFVMENLRPAQTFNTGDLPEIPQASAEAVDLTAQLKSFLGVQSSDHPAAVNKAVINPSSTSDLPANVKANGLLALLQSKASAPTMQPPQITVDQVTERFSKPPSPPQTHHQAPHPCTLRPPPASPIPPTQYEATMAQIRQPLPPQTRPIPPPQQPAQLIPRAARVPYQMPMPRSNLYQSATAPYQRTGDPQFAYYNQGSGRQLSSIPPANRLPLPKLNAHSSALLNLFKSGQSSIAPVANNEFKASGASMQQPLKAMSTMETDERSPHSNDAVKRPLVQQQPRESSSLMALFVPPQASPIANSAKANETVKPKSEHHDKLLNLFRAPSTSGAAPTATAMTSLQRHSNPVELSAFPSTPSHSRETSRRDASSQKLPPVINQVGPIQIQKRPHEIATKQQNAAVSATVNGPLNVPQFEMLAKIAKDQKQPTQSNGYSQRQTESPVTILARPRSSHGPVVTESRKPVYEDAPNAKQERDSAPRLQTFVTPIKGQPPTPNLTGQDVSSKSFQPQILRRPAHFQDLREPSPIQQLPSPQHRDFIDRRPTQTTDHKKSLLSLFTKPSQSPIISPSSANALSAVDPTITSTSIVSPLPPTPTPQQRADEAFTRLTKTVGPLSQPDSASPSPHKRPTLKMNDINSAMAEGLKSGQSKEKQASTSTPTLKTTPRDKEFLLDYLKDVARGAR